MENYILLVFPIIVIGILFFKVKISPGNTVWQDCWNRDDAKAIQVFAAFGVILHHLAQFISEYDRIKIGPIQIMTSMGILFTSIFFFYSGFGLMQSFTKKDNYLNGFLFNRLIIVVIPFLVTNIIYILPGFADERITSLFGLVTSILGFTLINTNAWYVVEIIIFYIAFYLFFRFIKNKSIAIKVYIGFIIAVIIGSVFLGHDFTDLNGHWFKGEWWYNSTIIFVMGLLFGKYRDKIVDFYNRNYIVKLIVSIILFAISFYAEEMVLHKYGYYHETHFYYNYGEKFITLAFQIITCIMFMQMILLITMKLRFNNIVIKKLSLITFEFYLVQDFTMQFFGYKPETPRYIIYAQVIISSLILAVAVYFADKFIIDLIDRYRQGKLSDSTTYEGKQKQKLIRKRMQAVALIYGILLLLTIVLFFSDLYYRIAKEPYIIRNEMETLRQADLYDEVQFGRLEARKLNEKILPITWIVVDKCDDKVLLVSKYALFETWYYQHYGECSYENSYIRKVLNDDFLYGAFRKKELEHIVPGGVADDMAFILSPSEVQKYLPDADMRKLMLIEMTVDKNERNIYRDKCYWWWLRGEDLDDNMLCVPMVDEEGLIQEAGIEVNRSNGKVRPAIWVQLEISH